MEQSMQRKSTALTRKQKRLIFYVLMLIWPVLQMSIFYIYVNFNSILLAFQKFEANQHDIGYIVTFAGFDNFKVAWNELIIGKLYMIGNSLKFFAIDYPTQIILCMSFSFYIYKKYPCSGIFKTVLYLPQIISGLVLGIIYKFLCDSGYRELVSLVNYGKQLMTQEHITKMINDGVFVRGGLLYTSGLAMPGVIFYCIYFSFGTSMLMYSSTMSGIDESVVESSHLDGCNVFQEFIHITFPLIFPTFRSLFVVAMCGLFTNTMNLMTLYGDTIPSSISNQVVTLGYDIFMRTSLVGNMKDAAKYAEFTPGELSAWGVIISVVMVPTIMYLKKLLEKFGPSVD